MSRLELVEQGVDDLYRSQDPNRDTWTDWMYRKHVKSVAEYGVRYAEQFHGNVDRVVAACLLHDIADTKISRSNSSQHHELGEEIARTILHEADFSENDIAIIVDDALRFHSCHGDERPQTLDGKIMATADAAAHLLTKFYDENENELPVQRDKSTFQSRVKKKIDHDFHNKIFFDEVRDEVEKRYIFLKKHFGVS